jgi:hypothetical protein
MPNVPAKLDLDRELVKAIAMDIGKEVVSHIRTMYPAAYGALGKSGALSVRNCTHNEIMAALGTVDADAIKSRLEDRKAFRRQQHRAYDGFRKPTPAATGRDE